MLSIGEPARRAGVAASAPQDWGRMSRAFTALEERMTARQHLRTQLDECIGCFCPSLQD